MLGSGKVACCDDDVGSGRFGFGKLSKANFGHRQQQQMQSVGIINEYTKNGYIVGDGSSKSLPFIKEQCCSADRRRDLCSQQQEPSACAANESEQQHDGGVIVAAANKPDETTMRLGKISAVLLATILLANYSFRIAQTHELQDNNSLLDIISTEIICPPFIFHEHYTSDDKPSLGLGSAAISSITDTLSPILPFTGGLDLRSKDLWDTSEGWYNAISSVVSQVGQAFAHQTTTRSEAVTSIPRGGMMPNELAARSSIAPKKTKRDAVLSEPFLDKNEIAELTLSDIGKAFQYASTRADFHEARFFRGLLPRVKNMLRSMDKVAAKSRGKGIPEAKTAEDRGDMDALLFCAAMRIFGEWRVIRLVPDGYKGYAVGMSLGQKDIVQNVAKIEQAVHNWLDFRNELKTMQQQNAGEKATDDDETRSPTIRELLQFEADAGVHPNLPRLKDKTAAMGLLWVRRQLQYQTSIFENLLKVPEEFATMRAAVESAYIDVYNKYHGWAVQKIFMYSFQAAPGQTVLLEAMNPHLLKEVKQQAAMRTRKLQALSDKEHHDVVRDEERNPIKNIGKEWEKFASFVGKLFQPDAKHPAEVSVRGGGVVKSDEYDAFVFEKMKTDAEERITYYLHVVQPLLDDLENIFHELNMNDPTKV